VGTLPDQALPESALWKRPRQRLGDGREPEAEATVPAPRSGGQAAAGTSAAEAVEHKVPVTMTNRQPAKRGLELALGLDHAGDRQATLDLDPCDRLSRASTLDPEPSLAPRACLVRRIANSLRAEFAVH
jgi:hypothetical protein